MATKPAHQFLETLKLLNDDDFASALAADPDLIKRAQKAVAEAKRIEAENIKRKTAKLAAQAGLPFDVKLWMKAKRLISGPYNDSNHAELKSILSQCTPNISPEGEDSLLSISLDYLADKTRVAFDWPKALYDLNAESNYPEIKRFFMLFKKRQVSDLGNDAITVFTQILGQNEDWADIEKKLIEENILSPFKTLSDFFKTKIFTSYTSNPPERAVLFWKALSNLVEKGCQPFLHLEDSNIGYSGIQWEQLANVTPSHPDIAKAKVETFKIMINRGWCDVGYTRLTDSLENRSLIGSSHRYFIKDCGSRCCIDKLPSDTSSIEIFNMLCMREQELGFDRYDAVGRSRLYFINEKGRNNSSEPEHQKIIASMARIALDLGDPPESVNPQNPISKCSSQFMAEVIASSIERNELRSTLNSTTENSTTETRKVKRTL